MCDTILINLVNYFCTYRLPVPVDGTLATWPTSSFTRVPGPSPATSTKASRSVLLVSNSLDFYLTETISSFVFPWERSSKIRGKLRSTRGGSLAFKTVSFSESILHNISYWHSPPVNLDLKAFLALPVSHYWVILTPVYLLYLPAIANLKHWHGM